MNPDFRWSFFIALKSIKDNVDSRENVIGQARSIFAFALFDFAEIVFLKTTISEVLYNSSSHVTNSMFHCIETFETVSNTTTEVCIVY